MKRLLLHAYILGRWERGSSTSRWGEPPLLARGPVAPALSEECYGDPRMEWRPVARVALVFALLVKSEGSGNGSAA